MKMRAKSDGKVGVHSKGKADGRAESGKRKTESGEIVEDELRVVRISHGERDSLCVKRMSWGCRRQGRGYGDVNGWERESDCAGVSIRYSGMPFVPCW